MRRWRVLVLAAGLGLLVAAAALAVTWRFPSLPAGGNGNLDTLADYGRVPDFALVERSGRTVTLADLRGAVWLANFIYTQCTETCPLQSAEVARLQREFAGARDLRLVSITVDPEHDTSATLAAYAARYGADHDRWLFPLGPRRPSTRWPGTDSGSGSSTRERPRLGGSDHCGGRRWPSPRMGQGGWSCTARASSSWTGTHASAPTTGLMIRAP